MKKRMYKTNRKYPCPYCDLKMYRDDLIHHVEDKHSSMLPEGYSAVRAVYDHINKKNYGTCMVCGDRVYEWDPNISRYKNICNKPSCINAVRAKALKNKSEVSRSGCVLNSHFVSSAIHIRIGSQKSFIFNNNALFFKCTFNFIGKLSIINRKFFKGIHVANIISYLLIGIH